MVAVIIVVVVVAVEQMTGCIRVGLVVVVIVQWGNRKGQNRQGTWIPTPDSAPQK